MKRRTLGAVMTALLSFSGLAAADSSVTIKDICMPHDGTGLMLRMEVENRGVLKAVVWGSSREDLLKGRHIRVTMTPDSQTTGKAEFCAGTNCYLIGAELNVVGKSPMILIENNETGVWDPYPVRVSRKTMDGFLCG